MPSKVQYSPHPDIVHFFQRFPFAYTLDGHEGVVITTVSRVRKFVEEIFGIGISKNILRGVLADVRGAIVGEAVNTHGHVSQICLFHVWSFKRRIEIALRNGEIRSK